MTFIYALVDPRDKQIRYIGKSDNPKRRLTFHKYDIKIHNTYKTHWLKSLLDVGLEPDILILEECDNEIWSEKEIEWINYYKRLGSKLTNLTGGGEGVPITPEIKQKMSIAGKRKIGKNNPFYGKYHSNETKRLISNKRLGKKRTEETNEKHSSSILQRKRANCSSQYIGVSICKWGWRARVVIKGEEHHFGIAQTEIEAAKIYDKNIIMFLQNPKLNFPLEK